MLLTERLKSIVINVLESIGAEIRQAQQKAQEIDKYKYGLLTFNF